LLQASLKNKDAKVFLKSSFLLLNTLTWLIVIRSVATKLMESFTHIAINTFYLGVIISMVIGGFISEKMKESRLLSLWLTFGIFASLLPLLMWIIKSIIVVFTVNFSLGFSFGLGIPSCLSHFTENTTYKNRAGMAGLIFLLSSLCAPILLFFIESNLLVAILLSFFWRLTSIAVLPSFVIVENRKAKTSASFSSILRNKLFLAYFIPLLMFCFVDSFEKICHEFFVEKEFLMLNRSIEPIFGAIFALIGGIFSDRVGRRRVIIYGFVSLGIAYAILGIAPSWVGTWYIYSIIDGISWGIFYTLYAIVLWGEIASPNQFKHKFYSVGGVPFFLSEFAASFFIPNIEKMTKEIAFTSFSMAAFFLFLAVIPLLYAQETLPESIMKERELKEYLEKAKKIKEKSDK